MKNITSEEASLHGPSQLPIIEKICRCMINTRRFSEESKSILQGIGVPDCVCRDTPILFWEDSEKMIPEGFIAQLQKEFDEDWNKFDSYPPNNKKE